MMKLVNVMLVCAVAVLISGSTAAQYGYELGPESNNYAPNLHEFPDNAVPSIEELTEFFLEELDSSQAGGVWSPDGERIAVTSRPGGMFLMPAGGGEPVSVFDDIDDMYDLGGGYWHAGRIWYICGFSPDGSDIIYRQTSIVDPDKVEVTLTEKDGGILMTGSSGIGNKVEVLRAVTISTGEVRDIATGSWATYSASGRYLGIHRYEYDPDS